MKIPQPVTLLGIQRLWTLHRWFHRVDSVHCSRSDRQVVHKVLLALPRGDQSWARSLHPRCGLVAVKKLPVSSP